MSNASNFGSTPFIVERARPDADPSLLSAREGLEKFAVDRHKYGLDDDLTNTVALRVLSGKSAEYRHPWAVWKAYFFVAADRIRASLGTRRSHEKRIFAEILAPAALQRDVTHNSPDRLMAAQEAALQVVAVFRTLSLPNQALLLQRDWLGHSIAAIAKARIGREDRVAANAVTKAHGRAQAVFIKRLNREFGHDFHVAGWADSETLRTAFLALAVEFGLSAPLDDSDMNV